MDNGKSINLIDAFNLIDKKKKGVISKHCILQFLNNHVSNAKFTIEDIKALYRRLTIGEDKLALSYLDFVYCLMPS